MRKSWVIPLEQNAEFVARMEDVLELYHLPYNPQIPLVCMDEQPVQLIKERGNPLPAEAGKPARMEYEYERNGTANVFMFTELPKAAFFGVIHLSTQSLPMQDEPEQSSQLRQGETLRHREVLHAIPAASRFLPPQE